MFPTAILCPLTFSIADSESVFVIATSFIPYLLCTTLIIFFNCDAVVLETLTLSLAFLGISGHSGKTPSVISNV